MTEQIKTTSKASLFGIKVRFDSIDKLFSKLRQKVKPKFALTKTPQKFRRHSLIKSSLPALPMIHKRSHSVIREVPNEVDLENLDETY